MILLKINARGRFWLEERGERQGIFILEKDIDNRKYFGGIRRRIAFFQDGQKFLDQAELGAYCLAAIDIEHFKLFNEWFGYAAGDLFLQQVARILDEIQQTYNGMAGYLFEDDFAILLPYDMDYLQQIYHRIMEYIRSLEHYMGFFPVIGVYVVDERLPISSIYDRARLAQNLGKGNYMKRVVFYERSMQTTLENEHCIILDVLQALTAGDITYFLQPKCEIKSGKIVGAEALVRWIKPDGTQVSPGGYIPLLEKNALIGQLDCYVWEAVCQDMRKWLDAGNPPMVISMNLSRVDVYVMDVVKVLQDLVHKYDLEPNLLEIEITESAYSRDFQQMSDIVQRLRSLGFRTSMDDFGSGYSSLNMLKDISIDILKIDMNFLKLSDESFQRGVGIVESIVNMARLLDIPVVAEGVETDRHRELLRDIGCRYVQGYLYYRPMPVPEFYEMISKEDMVDFRGMKAKPVNDVNVYELLNNNVISQSLLGRIMGPIAIYELHGTQVHWVKATREFYELLGESNLTSLSPTNRQNLIELLDEQEREAAWVALKNAREHPQRTTTIEFRYQRGGQEFWLESKVYYLKSTGDMDLFCGQVRDITDQKKLEIELEAVQKELYELRHLAKGR